MQTVTDSVSVAHITANVPRELQETPQWVLWRGGDRIDQKTGEVTGLEKVPYTIHRSKASTTNPQTWESFEQCGKALSMVLAEWEEEDPDAYRGGGLGFVLAAQDLYVGGDLDHCRNPETGEIERWAAQIVGVVNSYTEVSPSGTGLRIFARGKLPGNGQKRNNIELYDQKRFLTVTGAHLSGTPTTIEARQEVIEWLYVAMPLIAKLLADSERREKFQRLFTGDTSEHDGDESRADLAFCNMLVAGGARTIAECLAVIRLSGLNDEKWDRDDYQERTIRKALEGKSPAAKGGKDQSGSSRSLAAGDVVCLATIQPERVEWLWKPYLPLGKLCSLEGDPGTGKSTLTAALAAYVTTGRLFPGEVGTDREPHNVLFLQCEDDLGDTFRPRLEAAGADVSRVYALTVRVTIGDERLERALSEYRPALVVIDPLQGYIGAKINMNQSNEVRPIMERIRALAETYCCTVLCVRHLGKNQEQKAIHRALGSVDFIAALRSTLQVEGGGNPYTLKHIKANSGPKGRPLSYRIVSANVPLLDGGLVETSRIEWAEHESPTEGGSTQVSSKPGKGEEAADFLRSQLAGGPRLASAVLQAARERSITEITLNRTKTAMGVKSTGAGKYSYWEWPQPEPAPEEDIWTQLIDHKESDRLLALYS